jgi:rod shape-determining protein MreC
LRWDATRPGEFFIDPVPIHGEYRIGDPIITSGLGEIYPRGVLVGHVIGAEQNPRTLLKRIRVHPAARRGQIREVFLIGESLPDRGASEIEQTAPPAHSASESASGRHQ